MKTRIGLIIGMVIAAIIVAVGVLFATADTREYNKLLKLGDK